VHRWRGPLLIAAAGLLAWLSTRLLPATVAEAVYAPVGAVVVRAMAALTGLFPFATSELLLGTYLLWVALLGGTAVRAATRGRRRWRNVAAGGSRRVLRDGGTLLLAFYLLWGFNYARAPFPVQAGWPEWGGIELEELTALAAAATNAANESYLVLHGSEDADAATVLPADMRALEAAIDDGWRQAASLLALPPAAAVSHGPVKWPRASGVLARLGIAGIYVPFTAEAHVVRGLPAMRVPLSMAHEKAHQRGFTSEADANFLGYVASALAPDPLSRYSAAMFAQTQLMRSLLARSPDAFREIANTRLPGVQRDIEDLWAYSARMHGFAADVGTSMNDRFLMANGIRDGVQDYRRSAWLIVAFARLNGGEIMPAAVSAP
jgi:hypothetical protein